MKLYLAKENFAAAHEIALPNQISGYEYEIEACLSALEEERIECPEMPHSETIRMMEIMDDIRAQWNMIYPFEKT